MVTVAPRLGEVIVPAPTALLCLTLALVFSTTFEEIFFRGFLQTTCARAFGVPAAVVLSALTFALYHVGIDPHYRQPEVIAQMTLVGLMFAIGFQLTRNVLTSFALNLPHAVVTFITPRWEHGLAENNGLMEPATALLAVVGTVLALAWIAYMARSRGHEGQEAHS